MSEQARIGVEDYKLKASNGRHIRIATAVTFPSGRTIRFTERMGKREAIRQAAAMLSDDAWFREMTEYAA